jgi:hypothetical protein
VIVAQSYSTISHVTQTFNYGGGASTSFQVGISATGDFGTFGVEGTNSVATETGWKFTPTQGRAFNHWRTNFEWGSYCQKWTGDTPGCADFDNYTDQSYKWNGGNYSIQVSGAPAATECERVKPSDLVNKHNSVASTIKAGSDIAGFKGSVQTGYSTSASITFSFHLKRGQKAQLCGTVGKPAATPGVLVASPRK